MSELPADVIEDPRPILLCDNTAEQIGWQVAIWDQRFGGWFLGDAYDIEARDEAIEAGEVFDAVYVAEPTHWAELPPLPARQLTMLN